MASVSSTDMVVTGSAGSGGYASLLVVTVADLIAMHIQGGRPLDSAEFSNLCLSLARGIDYAIANHEIPVRARDLPQLLKQVLGQMNDSSLQAVVMVLMISVKNACRIGWFPDRDANDLLTLAKEIEKTFSIMEDVNVEPRHSLLNVPKIMLRYYPRLKMGQVLTSLEVKPGYGAFMVDFHITKSMVSPTQKYICLFVAEIDNTDSSSCIVTPHQANFLLNGKGVQGRTNVSMEKGPQLPTNLNSMLKYGVNVLQVVGQFNGNYIIVIAFMSVIPIPDMSKLQDYIQPVAATVDSDSEVIEGQAQISLNCPISFKRIKLPVKGHLCKHHQCFDYVNFIEMNSRRPSWHCPYCNQSVCTLDIRVDQKMVKILKEVGDDVVNVIISPDGSWKPVAESIDPTEQTCDRNCSNQPENSRHCEYVDCFSVPAEIVDLTMGGDNEDESQDVKPLQGASAAEEIVPPGINCTSEADQIALARAEDEAWLEMLMSYSAPHGNDAQASTNSNACRNVGVSRAPSGFIPSPFLPQETLVVHREAQVPTSSWKPQHSNPSNPPFQQSRFGSSVSNSGHGMVTLPNLSVTQAMGGPQNIADPSVLIRPVQVQQRGVNGQVTAIVANRQPSLRNAGQGTPQMLRISPSLPVQLQQARTGSVFSHGMAEPRLNMMGTRRRSPRAALSASENWQPSGRMRGSLRGESYSTAYNNQFMHRQWQLPQHPTNVTPIIQGGLPSFWHIPSSSNDLHLQPQAGNQARLRNNGAGSSGTLPEWTPRMP